MSSTKFDPEKDIAPIPFNEEVCQLALEMKRLGLVGRPHGGCFAWDPDTCIKQASPFPNRIYFVLSMPILLGIFDSTINMIEKLVWSPTWHQARSMCRQLEITDDVIFNRLQQDLLLDGDLKNIYKCICSAPKRRQLNNPTTIVSVLW
jgi:hypothetical protein